MPELMKPEQYLAKREAYAYPAVRPGDERGTVSKRYNQRDGSTHCQADQDTIPELEVGKKDMRFEVEGGGNERIGTLLVSKGGIEWRPYKKQKRHLSWEKFDRIIRDHWGD